jgi:hypothetical protein
MRSFGVQTIFFGINIKSVHEVEVGVFYISFFLFRVNKFLCLFQAFFFCIEVFDFKFTDTVELTIVYSKITATIINPPKFMRFLIFINKCSFHNIVCLLLGESNISTIHKSRKTVELSPICLRISSVFLQNKSCLFIFYCFFEKTAKKFELRKKVAHHYAYLCRRNKKTGQVRVTSTHSLR